MTFRRIPADPLTGWRHWLRHGHPPHLQDPRGIPRQNHEHLLRCALPQGTVIPPCVLLQCRNTATVCPVSYYNPTTLCPVSYYKAGISQCSHFVSCVLFQGRNIPVQSLCVLWLITRQECPSTVTLCPVSYYKARIPRHNQEHLHFTLPQCTVTLTATTLISCLPLECNLQTQSWSHTTSRCLTKNTDKTYLCQLFTISGF